MTSCSLLVLGQDEDRVYGLEDYAGGMPRWCPGWASAS